MRKSPVLEPRGLVYHPQPWTGSERRRSVRTAVGMFLSTHRLAHGELTVLAETLGVSTRTLRNWRDREGESRPPGRPGHPQEARAWAREHTQRVWKLLPRGHDGSRSARERLVREGIEVPVRLVRESVRALKSERAERERARIEENRLHVEVHARDAIWGLDQTHVSRDEQGMVKALVVREQLVPHTLGVSIGPPASGADVVRLLEQVAEERGTWPFVIQMDNGPENRNAEVAACTRAARVVILWDEPRTPEHNGRTERSIGSLKRAAALGRAAARDADPSEDHVSLREPGVLATRAGLCARLMRAWANLDLHTPRARLDGLTPAELDKIAPRAEDQACRARFYAEVREELERIALDPLDTRARRKREREAIWCGLERYGLVTRTRGGCLVPTAKAEGIS